jgi:NAD(P)-dependent dehydrogenase (short-subunit alcohol dehydrogenase family)
MQLQGNVALVTGGASGLGAATARRLAKGGAKIVLVDRDEARGGALAAELGAVFAKADVTDAAQVDAAVARAGELGVLRIAVSCAGVGWAARTLDKTGKPHDLELFRTVVGINLIGTFNVLRFAASAMIANEPIEDADGERGVCVNTASIAASGSRGDREGGAARRWTARLHRQYRVGRRVRWSDRAGRVCRVEGRGRGLDLAGGARPRTGWHSRRHDRPRYLRYTDARRAAR